MKDSSKTKEQLVQELAELRQRVAAMDSEGDKLQALMNGLAFAEIGIDIVKLDYKVVFQNESLRQRFGDLAGKLCYETYMGLKEPCDFCPAIKAIKSNKVEMVELTGADGRNYQLLSAPLPNSDGTIDKAIEIVIDVTERKQIDKKLQSSKEFSTTLLVNSPSPILVLDTDTSIRYVNPAFEQLTGFVSAELIGKQAPYPWWTEATIHKTRRDFEEAMAGGARKIEEMFKRMNGESFWAEITSVPVKRDGVVRYYLATWVDITERKKAEDTLRQSEERYRTILEEMEEGYFELDLAGNFTFINDSVARHLRYLREELIGTNAREYADEEDVDIVYKAFNKVYRTGEPVRNLFYRVVRKDGTVGFTEATVFPLRNENDEIIGFRGVGRDVTERKRIEDEKRQLEQKAHLASRLASVGEMASGIAHEINNPLTGVIGYAHLLLARRDISDDIKHDVEVINEGAQRVAGIVKRMLTFARQTKPERKRVNINEIVDNTLDLRAYHLKNSNIKVTTRLDPDLPMTIADPGQLQQVFLNLIINAETEMKSAHGKGKLLVKTEQMNDTIRISFKDDGSGIAKENLERIFDPFFTTKEVGQGTGLGLSVCHGIITGHNGRIYAESKPGKGATFVVELPIVTEQLELPEPEIEEHDKVANAKILVVDDEPVIQEFISKVLTTEGHEVETVDNAEDALEMVKSKRYRLILLDIKMPGMSGIELYEHLQKIAPSLLQRVVFVTGDVVGARTMAFLAKTRVPRIMKPFDAKRLRTEINRVLTEGM
ncbi:MAG: PAS domain S-box protein [Chloroflexi bacterium]|nr:PAS domain S-box protein [Chloroflexota bacterium]